MLSGIKCSGGGDSQSPEALLKHADDLSWLNAWIQAEPYYRRAEIAFRAKGESSKALYAQGSEMPRRANRSPRFPTRLQCCVRICCCLPPTPLKRACGLTMPLKTGCGKRWRPHTTRSKPTHLAPYLRSTCALPCRTPIRRRLRRRSNVLHRRLYTRGRNAGS